MTPWTAACQDPHPWGFSRQEYWSGSPFSFPICHQNVNKYSLYNGMFSINLFFSYVITYFVWLKILLERKTFIYGPYDYRWFNFFHPFDYLSLHMLVTYFYCNKHITCITPKVKESPKDVCPSILDSFMKTEVLWKATSAFHSLPL